MAQAQVTLLEQANPTRSFVLPVTPRELPETGQADVRSFRVIGAGQHSLPVGRSERHFTLQGTLPGPARQNLPHVHDWRPPQDVAARVRDWLEGKADLRYQADTFAGPIDLPVYIGRYQFTRTGSYGDMSYELELVERRRLVVRVDDGTTPSNEVLSTDESGSSAADVEDDPPALPTSYTVQSGDTLSFIAGKLLGDSGRWRELFDLNQGQDMGDGRTLADPNLIYPGWVLQVPGGTDTPDDVPVEDVV